VPSILWGPEITPSRLKKRQIPPTIQQESRFPPGTSRHGHTKPAFAPGKDQTQCFWERAAARENALNHRNWVDILFELRYMAIITLGTIAIIEYGSYQVFCGALTVGGLVASYSYIAEIIWIPSTPRLEIYSRSIE